MWILYPTTEVWIFTHLRVSGKKDVLVYPDESFLLCCDFMVLPKPFTGCLMFSKGTILAQPWGFGLGSRELCIPKDAQHFTSPYLQRGCHVVLWFFQVH